MEERSFATAGVALGGVALASAGLPWDAAGAGPVENVVLAGLGAAVTAAFSLRRHGLLAAGPGGLLAGVASLAVVGHAATAVGGVAAGVTSPLGVALALIGGVGGAVAAYGDARGIPDRAGAAMGAFARGLGLGFAGLVAISAWTSVAVSLWAAVVPGEIGRLQQLVVGSVALGLGTATVALVYFGATDREWSYVDVRAPDLTDAGYALAGVAILLGLQYLLTVAFGQLGITTASHSIERAARQGNHELLLWLIPTAFLVIGPGEELLYRNIVQKSFYETFSERGAVVAASVVFAIVHVLAYLSPDVGATLATLSVVFVLSLVLGVAYRRTGNLVVPIFIHGAYDAVTFGALYLELAGQTGLV
ncbi:CPBP family intramembrane glutamic endopeptidase [Halorussus marinus]|uniref:CPBP family intramembrane glutamic endopeptidase n=1 Tax=Halorussus marinus TaxID=2505976 RepID=UPI001092FA88|nr:CPBP family intramembrane glutamic endopeptidase [Halorussus marinus]